MLNTPISNNGSGIPEMPLEHYIRVDVDAAKIQAEQLSDLLAIIANREAEIQLLRSQLRAERNLRFSIARDLQSINNGLADLINS